MSSFVDDLLNRLFPKDKTPVYVTDSITWTVELEENYQAWKPDGERLLSEIKADISRQRLLDSSYHGLVRFEDKGANGVRMDLGQLVSPGTDLRLFGHMISEQITSLDYRLYSRKQKILESSESVENSFWYYFKPIPKIEEGMHQHDQKFGNLKVEIRESEKATELIFLRTYYSGRNYTEAGDFDELLNRIFGAD